MQKIAKFIQDKFPEAKVLIDHSQFILPDRLEHENALLNPVFPLYLGRRSCPPTGRLCLGIRKLELEEALLEEEFRNESIETVRIVMDAKKGENGNIVKDLPISYNPEHRKHMFRKVTEKYRAVREPLQCHDPMAELG